MKNLTAAYENRLNQIRRATYTALGRGQYGRAVKLIGIHLITAAQYRRMARAVESAEYFISK